MKRHKKALASLVARSAIVILGIWFVLSSGVVYAQSAEIPLEASVDTRMAIIAAVAALLVGIAIFCFRNRKLPLSGTTSE